MAGERKKPGVRIVAVIDEDVAAALRDAVYHSRDTISGFVQDAVAVRLSNHERPIEYVRGKREKKDKTPAKVFDPAVFDAYGFPLGMQPINPRMELVQARKHGPEGVRKLLRAWWKMSNLDPDGYTDAMLNETLRQMDAAEAT